MEQRRDYYVYGHYIKDTNELFYIGKGTGRRSTAMTKNDRSKNWFNFVNNRQVYSVILFSGLTEKEAFEKEEYLISIVPVS